MQKKFLLWAGIFLLTGMITLGQAQNVKKFLFIDDNWIEETYEVFRSVPAPEKNKDNPLIIADSPWEKGINLYGTVLFDDGVFRMWYQIYNSTEKEDTRFRTAVGYAESVDGIHWRKPELDLFAYHGSKKNNLVLLSYGATDLYSPAVVKDMLEKDPQKRYKMLYWDSMSEENIKKYGTNFPLGKNVPGWRAIPGEGFFVAFSPDGIHWQKRGPQPVFTCACDASSVVALEDGTFRAFFKISTRPDRHFRVLGMAESTDFVNWSAPEVILEPDRHDPYGTEFYGMSGFQYFGNFLGMIWMYHNSPSDKRMDIQLAASEDGRFWQRGAQRKTLLATGESGNWDAGGIVVASTPVVAPPGYEDKILLYYGGSTTRHDDQRYRENSIGLAVLRLDGFACLKAKQFKGYFRTKPLPVSGEKMFLNMNALHGFAEVEAIDPATGKVVGRGKPIRGLDKTRVAVAWSGENPLRKKGKLTFKVSMKKTSVYAIWFE